MKIRVRCSFLLLLFGTVILPAQQSSPLDTTTFVVIGESLAAGVADFALREVYQKTSFPAVMARQFSTAFAQPLIQAPGFSWAPGFSQLPVLAPGPGQTTVRSQFPPTLFVMNLAVPGHRLTDAIHLRPAAPLVQPDPRQMMTNLIIGFPALILGADKPLWTQLEYAVRMNPTLVLVALGYQEAMEAAANGDPASMPEPAAFRADYGALLAALQATHAALITATIPDPIDTAYFSTLAAAAAVTGLPAADIAAAYGLREGDLLTPNALAAIGSQAEALPAGSVMSASTAAAIRTRVRALNTEITTLSQQSGAISYDLAGLFARVRAAGLAAGSRRLTADYLGGFYSLSGWYPGATGHAAIANEILALLNRTMGASFNLVDLALAAAADPAVRFQPTGFGGGQ